MPSILTRLEQAILALSPVRAFRTGGKIGTSEYSGNASAPVPIFNGPVSDGILLVPGSGVVCPESTLFNGSTNYINLPTFAAQRSAAFSSLLVVGKPTAPTSGNSKRFWSCTDSGGWAVPLVVGGGVNLQVYRGGSYGTTPTINVSAFQTQNIILTRYDGSQLARFQVNDQVVNHDFGSAVTLTYNSATSLFVGAEPAGSTLDTDYPLLDAPVFTGAIWNRALSDEEMEDLYDKFFTSVTLAGSAKLDNGLPASRVVISDWTKHLRGEVTPGIGGAWTAEVEPEQEYLVTTIGPAGYQPVSHGPVIGV
jgi:hypothetical protein